MTPPRLSRLLSWTRREIWWRERKRAASSNPIVLVTLKEPSMPEHDTVEYVFYIFSKHRRPVRSRRSMAIHNATAYLSAKRGGGRGGIGRTREREFPATDVTMEKLFRPRESLETKLVVNILRDPFFLGIFLLSDRSRRKKQ